MPRVNRTPFIVIILSSMLAGGCSLPKGEFPSLAKRPYESSDPIAEPPAEPAQLSTTLPEALQAQLGAVEARHRAADAAFAAALPATRAVAISAAGSAMGSEAWVNAHLQLSRLEEKRADSLGAQAEVDGLIAAERLRGADAGIIALMEPYQQRIQAGVEAQTAALEELARRIR